MSSELGVTFSISNAFSCKINPLCVESAHINPYRSGLQVCCMEYVLRGGLGVGANCAAELIAGLCWADKV